MGGQQSVACCSVESSSRPLGPVVTQRIYGHDALLVATVRLQSAARRWIARRRVSDVRRRSVGLLQDRRDTLQEQLLSLMGRFEAELQQNANLQAVIRSHMQAGASQSMPDAVGERVDERGLRQKAWTRTLQLVGRGPVPDVSGVWHATGEQAGVALEETFLLMQDDEPQSVDMEALRDELREYDTPEDCFRFARACGVARGPLDAARRAQHPRAAAIGLVLEHLARKPFEATFRGSCSSEGNEMSFVIRRGRVLRSDSNEWSIVFTQRYVDGEEVTWHAKVEGRDENLRLEQGHWSGAGHQGGGFSATRTGNGDEARWSDAGVLELRSRALSVGVSLAAVIRSLKTPDPEGELRALIISEASGLPSSLEARVILLRRALESESLSALTARAEQWAYFHEVETALDSTKPKQALVDLLVRVATSPIAEYETDEAESDAVVVSLALGGAGADGAANATWSPAQLDPWWFIELPVAEKGCVWFRKPDQSYIQLSEAERSTVQRYLAIRLGDEELTASVDWQVGPNGEPLEEVLDTEAARRMAMARRVLCWSAANMTGAARVELSSRDTQRANVAAASASAGAIGLLVSARTLLRGEKEWGLHGLALERDTIEREVNVLEDDCTMLRRRWKWWKEQNCYLQQAQSVAMGNADMQLQNDRSFLGNLSTAISGGGDAEARRLVEDDLRYIDDDTFGSWIGGGGELSPREGEGASSVMQAVDEGISGLIRSAAHLRSAETRDAWRLAGVWCAVGRTRDHYWDGSVVSTLDEGEMFVLEVGVSGTVTGRALPTSKLSTSLHDSTVDELFEMINVRLGDDNRVRMTQVYANGSATEWQAVLFGDDQMVDGKWSGNGWSSGFTALRLPEEEAAALLTTGRSVATAPKWRVDMPRKLLRSPLKSRVS